MPFPNVPVPADLPYRPGTSSFAGEGHRGYWHHERAVNEPVAMLVAGTGFPRPTMNGLQSAVPRDWAGAWRRATVCEDQFEARPGDQCQARRNVGQSAQTSGSSASHRCRRRSLVLVIASHAHRGRRWRTRERGGGLEGSVHPGYGKIRGTTTPNHESSVLFRSRSPVPPTPENPLAGTDPRGQVNPFVT